MNALVNSPAPPSSDRHVVAPRRTLHGQRDSLPSVKREEVAQRKTLKEDEARLWEDILFDIAVIRTKDRHLFHSPQKETSTKEQTTANDETTNDSKEEESTPQKKDSTALVVVSSELCHTPSPPPGGSSGALVVHAGSPYTTDRGHTRKGRLAMVNQREGLGSELMSAHKPFPSSDPAYLLRDRSPSPTTGEAASPFVDLCPSVRKILYDERRAVEIEATELMTYLFDLHSNRASREHAFVSFRLAQHRARQRVGAQEESKRSLILMFQEGDWEALMLRIPRPPSPDGREPDERLFADEDAGRSKLTLDESSDRHELHAELLLRISVQLFSCNRMEVNLRDECEEDEQTEWEEMAQHVPRGPPMLSAVVALGSPSRWECLEACASVAPKSYMPIVPKKRRNRTALPAHLRQDAEERKATDDKANDKTKSNEGERGAKHHGASCPPPPLLGAVVARLCLPWHAYAHLHSLVGHDSTSNSTSGHLLLAAVAAMGGNPGGALACVMKAASPTDAPRCTVDAASKSETYHSALALLAVVSSERHAGITAVNTLAAATRDSGAAAAATTTTTTTTTRNVAPAASSSGSTGASAQPQTTTPSGFNGPLLPAVARSVGNGYQILSCLAALEAPAAVTSSSSKVLPTKEKKSEEKEAQTRASMLAVCRALAPRCSAVVAIANMYAAPPANTDDADELLDLNSKDEGTVKVVSMFEKLAARKKKAGGKKTA